eukprot:TRINITY_DN1944_c0_g1_i1.p2 TRINITY_DN1944_c0_g1~~TRINITY_DN1944_c0_g1_i1.p2  ORF type:complete len:241 (-),score=78.45 TRINITY_DN1944_c0_g1_i1:951-1673(-)
MTNLSPDKIYFQIVSVQPYFKDPNDPNRVTNFEGNFNIRQFISEVPFMSDGRKMDEDDIAHQQKKKTIFTAEKAFPSITSRIPVIHSEHIILTPIQCAIEMIQRRVEKFRSEVNSNPPRRNNLQAILQGTLATTVHVGPLKFCEVFLTNAHENFPPEEQTELRERMAEMLLFAERALALNSSIIVNTNQLPLQEVLEEKYNNILTTWTEKYQGDTDMSALRKKVFNKDKATKNQLGTKSN